MGYGPKTRLREPRLVNSFRERVLTLGFNLYLFPIHGVLKCLGLPFLAFSLPYIRALRRHFLSHRNSGR